MFINRVDYTYRVYCYLEHFSWNVRLVRVRGGIAADVCSKAQSMNDATWYHICGRYNGTTLNLKINDWTAATLGSSGNGSWSGYWNETAVWACTGWGGTNFKGMPDVLQVFNIYKTDAEVTELYGLWAGKQVPFATPNSNFLFYM